MQYRVRRISHFYDLSLTPLVRLYDPKETKINYSVTKEDNAFKGFISYTYVKMCSTSDYIFLAYSGASPTVDELMQHDIEDSGYPAYVMQFDWDGNLKGCHMMKSLPYGIYVREGDNHTLYFTISDENGKLGLYSCIIP